MTSLSRARIPGRGHNKPPYTTEAELDDYEDLLAFWARRDLFEFRTYMDPEMLSGWWVREVSMQLQRFYERLINDERPKLLLEAPPQHGKSRALTDFIAWVAGRAPNIRTMYASYSDDLGVRANTTLQRMMDDRNKFGRVFPETSLSVGNVVTMVTRPQRNSGFLEYVGQKGSFANVTVQGQVTGKSLDLGFIDDPIKGRVEAQSPRLREKTWNWLTDDFFSRFSDKAGFVMTMTRWHLDDPGGRFLKLFPDATVLRYPVEALSRSARKVIMKDPLVLNSANDPRVKDELLFPEFKSREFIDIRKKMYTQASWQSLYQQSPIIAGGSMFPIELIKVVANRPAAADIRKTVRYWDKAGTAGGGAYSAGVRMHLLLDGRVVISDVRRGQWSSFDREKMIKACADMDEQQFDMPETWIEQEPGSGGKESAERTVSNLKGKLVYVDRVTGKKEVRAEPYAAAWQGGLVCIVDSDKYFTKFLDEHEAFPASEYKDQVDAAAGAFIKLVTNKYNYDETLNWAV